MSVTVSLILLGTDRYIFFPLLTKLCTETHRFQRATELHLTRFLYYYSRNASGGLTIILYAVVMMN